MVSCRWTVVSGDGEGAEVLLRRSALMGAGADFFWGVVKASLVGVASLLGVSVGGSAMEVVDGSG